MIHETLCSHAQAYYTIQKCIEADLIKIIVVPICNWLFLEWLIMKAYT